MTKLLTKIYHVILLRYQYLQPVRSYQNNDRLGHPVDVRAPADRHRGLGVAGTAWKAH